MISILRRYRPGRTRSLSLHGANRGRCCDFSRDPEERASFEYLAVIYHLSDDLQHVQIEMATSRYTDVSICPYRSPLHVEFLTPSQVRNWFVVTNKTYQELPGQYRRMLCRLAGKVINGSERQAQYVCSLMSWTRP